MRKNNMKNGKKSMAGILLSILFTAVVPIGFVFLMGLLSESFPVLYFYTKQIFIAFVVLTILGIGMIIYQIVSYIRGGSDPKEEQRRERRERREQRRAKERAETSMKHGQMASKS